MMIVTAFIWTIAALCLVPDISAKECPADMIRKFHYSLSNSFDSDGWWDLKSMDADDVKLRVKPIRQINREAVNKALVCSDDDDYASQKFANMSIDLEIKYDRKCGGAITSLFSNIPFNATRTINDVTVSSDGKNFICSGVSQDIDYLEECSLGVLPSDKKKDKRKKLNMKIRTTFTTGLINKFLDATRNSILNWGKCTFTVLDTYGAIFQDLAKTWVDVPMLADDKKPFEDVKALRAKLYVPPNRPSMTAAMYCDASTQDFSELKFLPEDNLAILLEADSKDGEKKCTAKLKAKTTPLKVSVERSRRNEIRVLIDTPNFETDKDEACRLASGIAVAGVKVMQDVLAEKITDLATACSASATQKLSTALDKMFKKSFKFANGAGVATFDVDITAASTVKFRCDIAGTLAGATSMKDLSVSLSLKLSTARCAAVASTEIQTAKMKLPMRFDVGWHIQGIKVHSKAQKHKKIANCWNLEEHVKAGVPNMAFADRVRDAVIDALYTTWKQCPSEILDALAFALEAEDYEKSSSSKSGSTSSAKERHRRRRRHRSKRSSKAFKGFSGMKMKSFIIGCDKDTMPGAKISRFVAKESSTYFFAAAQVSIRATCTETIKIPCSSATDCNGGCYRTQVLSSDRYCESPYSCGSHPCCTCCSAVGCTKCHSGLYGYAHGPCKPKTSGGMARVTSESTATRSIKGRAALEFDYSQGEDPIGSSFRSYVDLSIGHLQDCRENIRSMAEDDISKEVKNQVIEVFAKFT